MTRRAFWILDLADAIRLFTGDDIKRQFRRASSEEENITCSLDPSRVSGDRKARGNGHNGYVIPAFLSSHLFLGRSVIACCDGYSH